MVMGTDLCDAFRQVYGKQPDFVVQCPGRVNLIGEHIDYSGYGVLPMALEQSITAVVKRDTNSEKIELRNFDSDKFPQFECDWGIFDIDRSNPQWFHYFLCGYRGMYERLNLGNQPKIGMQLLLHGTIPPSAGLSSSSALVCCAALCTLQAVTAQGFQQLSRTEVAELCAKCERYIGTEGGGMDQAICLLAEEGKATNIEFNPLRTKLVSLPPGCAFVVCHSGVQMNKAASSYYNERVVECRLAAQMCAKAVGLDWEKVRTLGQLQEKVGESFEGMRQNLIAKILPNDTYSKTEICSFLDVDESRLIEVSLSPNTLHMVEFKLPSRANHVYSEAERVNEFARICQQDPSLESLGNLMNDSHSSCAQNYECSCPELDELVEASRLSGAVGSRLTGAGWGGCTVSLVPEANVERFLGEIKGRFYGKSAERKKIYQKAVFVTKPAAGATISVL